MGSSVAAGGRGASSAVLWWLSASRPRSTETHSAKRRCENTAQRARSSASGPGVLTLDLSCLLLPVDLALHLPSLLPDAVPVRVDPRVLERLDLHGPHTANHRCENHSNDERSNEGGRQVLRQQAIVCARAHLIDVELLVDLSEDALLIVHVYLARAVALRAVDAVGALDLALRPLRIPQDRPRPLRLPVRTTLVAGTLRRMQPRCRQGSAPESYRASSSLSSPMLLAT